MKLQELRHLYGIDQDILDIWAAHESDTLLPVQQQAIQEYHILDGRDVLVSAPTSSGKTFLAEIAAVHTIYQRKQVLYILPLKALAEEKYADFISKYADFGLDIVISTGDRTEFDAAIERGDFQLAVMVFEKANRLLVRNRHFLNNCGLIIIDEIQMTSDLSRGSNLEMLITTITAGRDLQAAPESRTHPQIIALSAVMADPNRLDAWLNLDMLCSSERPVELREGILRKDGTFTYRSALSGMVDTEQFPPFPAHLSFNQSTAAGRQEYEYRRLQHTVAHCLAQGDQILVFLKWKSMTRDTALRLARDLQLPPALPAIEAVHAMEESISKDMLLEALRHGVAFHNADLGRDERRAIEQHFQAVDSKIRVICATSTLAMGINLPVKTVIINNLEKPDTDSSTFQEVPLSAAEYKNMSGRAGRLKRQIQGRSILFADTPAEERILWRNYIDGSFPRMDSLLTNSTLLQEVLFLVAADICRTEDDLTTFLHRTYAGTLYWRDHAEAGQVIQTKLNAAVEFCISHGLMARLPGVPALSDAHAPGRLQITEIGKVCASQGVSVESFVLLEDFFASLDPTQRDDWSLLFLVTHNREVEELHFRLSQAAFEAGDYWRATEEIAPEHWTALVKKSETILQSRFEVTKRLKMALLLLDWVSGLSLQRLEVKYSQFYRDKSYSGVIRGLAENAGWMLRLLADLAAVNHEASDMVQRLQTLADMALYGVTDTGVELAALHVPGLTRIMVMQLARAGYTTEEQVLEAELEELARVIPKDIAFRLQDRLYRKYSRAETRHLVDQKLRLERLGYDSALLKQVYGATDSYEFDEALMQLFRTPALKLLLSDIARSYEQPPTSAKTGRDYVLEQAQGAFIVRILPPNIRELDDAQFGNLFAVGAAYDPRGFILIGRPDFSEAASAKARQFSAAYGKHVLLYPAYEVCERYVQALEGKAAFALGD